MGTNANQMMQVVYIVKAIYLASLKLAGTLRVFEMEKKKFKNQQNILQLLIFNFYAFFNVEV